jgi:hypothetical protein
MCHLLEVTKMCYFFQFSHFVFHCVQHFYTWFYYRPALGRAPADHDMPRPSHSRPCHGPARPQPPTPRNSRALTGRSQPRHSPGRLHPGRTKAPTGRALAVPRPWLAPADRAWPPSLGVASPTWLPLCKLKKSLTSGEHGFRAPVF